MKHLPLLLLAGAFLFAAPNLPAIPQTVGGIFLNASGNPRRLPVEDWFKEPGHWQLSTLPQVPWTTGSESTWRMLSEPGQVFGFTAESVVVNSSPLGADIVSVAIHFKADVAKMPASDLLKRLARNVALGTGASEEKDKNGKITFAGKEYTVELKELKSMVTATLKR